MTNEEAIEILKKIIPTPKRGDSKSEFNLLISLALSMGIKALEQEPKTGHWIEHEIEGTLRWLECSNCHYETYNVKHNYCMNCGIKMEVEEKSCSNCKFWSLDKNDENRRCSYCYNQDEWQKGSEDKE